MDLVFKAIHVLAACVWVGGTVALVFIAVPAARRLQGDERASMLRALGRGWRPLGWGAMALLGASGIELAVSDDAFGGAGRDFDALLGAKLGLVSLLVVGAFLHDFVLGPTLARQIREGRPQTARRPLVFVGWANFALTVTIPVLGVALAHLG
ncbi:MAG: hypothetical protein C4306_11780 [Thermoleophilia bacterium]